MEEFHYIPIINVLYVCMLMDHVDHELTSSRLHYFEEKLFFTLFHVCIIGNGSELYCLGSSTYCGCII